MKTTRPVNSKNYDDSIETKNHISKASRAFVSTMSLITASVAHHDKLAYRLTQILIKLNQGDKLDAQALAAEFSVHVRTIQRDLKVRFAFLPLERKGDRYFLNASYLGKLNLRDLEHFAGLAGVRGLFPSLSDDFLRDIFDNRLQSALLVRGHNYETLDGRQDSFQHLEQAILTYRRIGFTYNRSDGAKAYAGVEPYRLINQDGIWYLAARDGPKLKAYTFSKIKDLQVGTDTFTSDPAVNSTLLQEDSIWLSENKTEVVLKVSRQAAEYFRQRKLIASQVIEKELEDGGLIVSCKVAHPNQILPIVRYWLPNVRIINPEIMQTTLEADLKAYLAAS